MSLRVIFLLFGALFLTSANAWRESVASFKSESFRKQLNEVIKEYKKQGYYLMKEIDESYPNHLERPSNDQAVSAFEKVKGDLTNLHSQLYKFIGRVKNKAKSSFWDVYDQLYKAKTALVQKGKQIPMAIIDATKDAISGFIELEANFAKKAKIKLDDLQEQFLGTVDNWESKL